MSSSISRYLKIHSAFGPESRAALKRASYAVPHATRRYLFSSSVLLCFLRVFFPLCKLMPFEILNGYRSPPGIDVDLDVAARSQRAARLRTVVESQVPRAARRCPRAPKWTQWQLVKVQHVGWLLPERDRHPLPCPRCWLLLSVGVPRPRPWPPRACRCRGCRPVAGCGAGCAPAGNARAMAGPETRVDSGSLSAAGNDSFPLPFARLGRGSRVSQSARGAPLVGGVQEHRLGGSFSALALGLGSRNCSVVGRSLRGLRGLRVKACGCFRRPAGLQTAGGRGRAPALARVMSPERRKVRRRRD